MTFPQRRRGQNLHLGIQQVLPTSYVHFCSNFTQTGGLWEELQLIGWGRLEEHVPSIQLCKYCAEVFSVLEETIIHAGCKHSTMSALGSLSHKPINSLVPQEELSKIQIWFVVGTLEDGGSHGPVSHPTPPRVNSLAAGVLWNLRVYTQTRGSFWEWVIERPKERQEVSPLRWHS